MLILVVDVQEHAQAAVRGHRRLVALGAVDQAGEHGIGAGDAVRGLAREVDLLHLADQLPELGDLVAIGEVVGDLIDLVDQGVEIAGVRLARGERVADRLLGLVQLARQLVGIAIAALGQAEEGLVQAAQLGDDERELLRRVRRRQDQRVIEDRGVERDPGRARRRGFGLGGFGEQRLDREVALLRRLIGEGVVLHLALLEQRTHLVDAIGAGPLGTHIEVVQRILGSGGRTTHGCWDPG